MPRQSIGIRTGKEDKTILFRKKSSDVPLSGFADIHCHILPAIDDGANDLDITKGMLKMAYQSGTRQLIATPHYYPDRFPYSDSDYRQKLAAVKELAYTISPDLSVYPGSEIYFESGILDLLMEENIYTLNHTDYILLEFMPLQPFSYMLRGIQEVQKSGARVILAHPERYLCLQDQIERVYKLREMGILFQVTAASVTGADGKTMQKLVNHWLRLKQVDFVASDAHNTSSRPPRLRMAAEIIHRKYGEEYMQALFFRNARTILLNEG